MKSNVNYFGRLCVVECDERCDKARGRSNRSLREEGSGLPKTTATVGPSIAEMRSEIVRELSARESLYPRLVAARKMTESTAARRVEILRALVVVLDGIVSSGQSRE
jgi:hypothetical protein